MDVVPESWRESAFRSLPGESSASGQSGVKALQAHRAEIVNSF